MNSEMSEQHGQNTRDETENICLDCADSAFEHGVVERFDKMYFKIYSQSESIFKTFSCFQVNKYKQELSWPLHVESRKGCWYP